MSEIRAEHTSGVAVDWLYVRELSFVDLQERTEQEAVGNVNLNLEVKNHLSEDGRSCRVWLRLTMTPEEPRTFSQLSAAVEAQFSTADEAAPAVPMEEFMRKQGPVILMPFLRDAIATATSKGRLGTVLLPPFNVASLVEELERAVPTGAVKA